MKNKLKIAMPLLVLSSLLVACKGKVHEMTLASNQFYKTINIEKDKTYKFRVSDTSKAEMQDPLENESPDVVICKCDSPEKVGEDVCLLLDEIYQDSIKIRTNKELTKVDSTEPLSKDTYHINNYPRYENKFCLSVGEGSLNDKCKSIEFEFKSKVSVTITAFLIFDW